MSSLLLKLPAELKLTIYKLVFTPKYDSSKWVNVKFQRDPSCDLLLTCREILKEAKPSYDTAMEKFSAGPYRYFTTIAKASQGATRRDPTQFAGRPHLPGAQTLRITFTRCKDMRSKFAVEFTVSDDGIAQAHVVDPATFEYCSASDVEKAEEIAEHSWEDEPGMVTASGFLNVAKCFEELCMYIEIKMGGFETEGIWYDEGETFQDSEEEYEALRMF